MKNPKTTSVLVGLGLVLVLAYGYAQGRTVTYDSTNTFINNTGQAVGGLHIEYNTGGIWQVDQNPATFGTVQVDGTAFNLRSGTLADGGSVQINAYAFGSVFRGNVQKWWWTDGSGILVGQTHTGCRNPDCTDP